MLLTTQEELEQRLAFWRERLEIDSTWNIKIRFATPEDKLEGADRGQITTIGNFKVAIIMVRDPRDGYVFEESYDAEMFEMYPSDTERTIIHELLHVKANFWNAYTENNAVLKNLEEQYTDSMARSILKLWESGKRD